MPNFKKNTSSAMKRSGFKMKGYTYGPLHDENEEKVKDEIGNEEKIRRSLMGNELSKWNEANPKAKQAEMNEMQTKLWNKWKSADVSKYL